ncbi:MAG: GNAT family N-acetyltransferase [Clostridiales bacterium]|nr:GNAT family N-acetyltransferase [Clostridiales bacterium]
MKDITAVGEIYIQAFGHQPESIRFYKLEPYVRFCIDEGYAFISEDEGRIEGFIIGYEKPDMFNGKIAYIELLAMRPEAQHRGNAKRLIERFIESAQAKGIKEVSVSTACYKDAYLIYRHLGFSDAQSDLRTLFKRI